MNWGPQMINFSTLNFGDTVYFVEQVHAFRRQKLKMVDEHGIEWYRYDAPVWSYTIVPYTYVGKADVVVEGRVDREDIDETKYFIETKQGDMTYLYNDDLEKDWFYTSKEAEAEIDQRRSEDKK